MSSQSSKKDFWVFISYASLDTIAPGKKVDPRFTRFYEKLAIEIARVKGFPVSFIEKGLNFYDRQSIEAGADWDTTLMEAVQSSKVFLCLLSKSYITSKYCGKEFHAFSERVRQHARYLKTSDARPEMIIPILWDIPNRYVDKLPEALQKIQYKHASFGDMYAQEGAYGLLKRRTKAFETFVERLAERICEVADDGLPRFPIKPLSETDSAWDVTVPAALPPAQSLSLATGYETAWFIYTAGGQSDYATIRQHRDCYGSSGSEWKPYDPPQNNIINDIAPDIARALGLQPNTASLSDLPSDQFLKQLQEADDSNTMVIIVVDPWSMHLTAATGPLKEYDRTRLINCGVVVLWNDDDKETRQRRQELEEKLSSVFERNLVTTDVTFQPLVHSVEDLRDKLAVAIKEVKDRIYRRGKGVRARATPRGETLPHLSAISPTRPTQDTLPGGAA